MSAWAEAVYVIKEMRKAIISEELLEKLKNKRNIIAGIARDGADYIPAGHSGETYMDESLWLVTGDDSSEGDYVLTVIDTLSTGEDAHIKPTHQGDKDEYLINSVWLIQDTGGG